MFPLSRQMRSCISPGTLLIRETTERVFPPQAIDKSWFVANRKLFRKSYAFCWPLSDYALRHLCKSRAWRSRIFRGRGGGYPSFVHAKAGPSHRSLQRLSATFLATYQTPDGTKTVRAKTVAVPRVVPTGVPHPNFPSTPVFYRTFFYRCEISRFFSQIFRDSLFDGDQLAHMNSPDRSIRHPRAGTALRPTAPSRVAAKVCAEAPLHDRFVDFFGSESAFDLTSFFCTLLVSHFHL